ncbi:MAG: M1 family metallopeptidase [Bacteroides sp.]|nr:M1 family metallopeptidase [Bacillota bacterium]MCM1393339.1 M1 family metallopeptidase [[Eubacterium] siraeum]MCM1455433.1 M1 family metallopeptidase [Bacteroides sp.]
MKLLKRSLAVLLAALALLAGCILLFSCNKRSDNPLANSPCYELTIDLDGDVLNVSQEVLYTSPANVDGIVFNVYANAFKEDAIEVLSAQINRKNVDCEIYGDDNTLLKLDYSARKGQSLNIRFEYNVKLPKSDTRLGITKKNTYNLACFYPVVARYEDGYREDCYNAFGDPFYHDISSFYVNLTLDKDFDVACSGQIVETHPASLDENEKKTVEIEAEYIRDFAMTVGKLNEVSTQIAIGDGSVAVRYFYVEDPYPALTLDRITSALSVFSKAFGDYPYPSYTVVQSNLSDAGGMEYGSFATVSILKSRDDYLDTVTHETAHQWWYNLVGNDQINSAWLDEGLTEFCTYYYSYLTDERIKFIEEMASIKSAYATFCAHKDDVGFDGSMNRPLSSYLTDGEYVAVTYFKGALLFETLRTLAGDSKFEAAMRRYCKDNAYGIATADSLISAFKAVGLDVANVVYDWINDAAPI